MNICIQHRLKYGEFDVGNATCQEEVDADKKLGRDRVMIMSLLDRKQVETLIQYYWFCTVFLSSNYHEYSTFSFPTTWRCHQIRDFSIFIKGKKERYSNYNYFFSLPMYKNIIIIVLSLLWWYMYTCIPCLWMKLVI